MVLHFDYEKTESGSIPAAYYYNEALKHWIFIGGTEDRQGVLSFETEHFAKIAVFAHTGKALNDIKNHWAKGAIDRLAGMGVINGYSDQFFRPDKQVTRAEFINMVVEASGISAPTKFC